MDLVIMSIISNNIYCDKEKVHLKSYTPLNRCNTLSMLLQSGIAQMPLKCQAKP